jgi:hypothetical protein
VDAEIVLDQNDGLGVREVDVASGGIIFLNSYELVGAFYDLRTNTLSHIDKLFCDGDNPTVQINSAVAGGVAKMPSSIT